MGEPRLRFELLGPEHLELRATFDCGVPDLNRYFAERARKEGDQGLARVHVLYDASENQIAGYYTLSSMSVQFQDVPRSLAKRDDAVVRFYERFGFRKLEDHERRLFYQRG